MQRGIATPPKRTEIQRKGEKDSVRRKRSRKRKSETQREEGGIDTQRKGWGERLREAEQGQGKETEERGPRPREEDREQRKGKKQNWAKKVHIHLHYNWCQPPLSLQRTATEEFYLVSMLPPAPSQNLFSVLEPVEPFFLCRADEIPLFKIYSTASTSS